MTQRLLDIMARAGDENLGQTLLRLARLAESAHRFEAAAALKTGDDISTPEIDGVGPVCMDGPTGKDAPSWVTPRRSPHAAKAAHSAPGHTEVTP